MRRSSLLCVDERRTASTCILNTAHGLILCLLDIRVASRRTAQASGSGSAEARISGQFGSFVAALLMRRIVTLSKRGFKKWFFFGSPQCKMLNQSGSIVSMNSYRILDRSAVARTNT